MEGSVASGVDDPGMPKQRAAKPREENEVEFSRIVAFSDGVFAIAITLLVLNLGVPEHVPHDDLGPVLWEQRNDLFAYAISFAVIGRFWIVHHRFFGEVTKFDGRLLTLNLFYLAWIVLIPFSSQVLGDHGGDTDAVILYALNLAAVSLVGMLMFFDARQAGLATGDPEHVRQQHRRALFVAGVFLASVPVAFANPHLVPLVWLGLFLEPLIRRRGAG